jgi:hypothetical protein
MSLKSAREGSLPELLVRKVITSLIYFRGYKLLFPNSPYYTPGAVRALKKLLHQNIKMFEYGCGKSSIWYAKQVQEYIAVEHEKSWYEQISEKIRELNLSNCTLLYIPLNEENNKFNWRTDWSPYKQLPRIPKNPKFLDYIRSISKFPDKYFNFIVIDGRERVHCLMEALPKLKDNGYILFDDTNRPRYKEIFQILKDWQKRSFDFGLAQTTLFFRKNNIDVA